MMNFLAGYSELGFFLLEILSGSLDDVIYILQKMGGPRTGQVKSSLGAGTLNHLAYGEFLFLAPYLSV